ncbi:lasso peptide biosynthesis B2 protein [Sphingomonas oryzagri]
MLDLSTDRYRLIGARETEALVALAAGVVPTDEAALGALHAQGLLTTHGRPVGLVEHALPIRSALELPSRTDAILPFVDVLAAVMRASLGLRFRGLRRVLDASSRLDMLVAITRRDTPEGDAAMLAGLTQSYVRQRRRIPSASVCLRDSVALRRLLAHAGFRTSLVIAVRLAPFAAHCWLEADDLILNDICDGVSGYTPILVA